MRIVKAEPFTYALALTAGQLLSGLSVFFWSDSGRHTPDASVLTILSMVFWSYGFVGLFGLFKQKSPWYSRLGLMYAFYGCLGGIAFGFEGLYSAIFSIHDKMGVEAYGRFPLQMNLVLFWSGPAFPITLLLFGIMFIAKKIDSSWIGILFIVGAVAFPISRVSRLGYIAHLADVILLVPIIIVSLRWIGEKNPNEARLDQ